MHTYTYIAYYFSLPASLVDAVLVILVIDYTLEYREEPPIRDPPR